MGPAPPSLGPEYTVMDAPGAIPATTSMSSAASPIWAPVAPRSTGTVLTGTLVP